MHNNVAKALEWKLTQSDAPIYPLFLKVIYSIFGEGNHTSALIIQGLIGSLMVIVIYLLVLQVCNRRAALLSAGICGIYPAFIIFEISLFPESLLIFLAVCIMALSVSVKINQKKKSILLGALMGLGMLTKPTFLFFLPGLALTTKKRLLFLLTLIIVLIPWTARNAVVSRTLYPLYQPKAYMVDLSKYTFSKESLGLFNRLYTNTSFVLRKSWDEPNMPKLFENRHNNTGLLQYSYTVVLILGLIGMVRFYRKEHRQFMLPVLLYIVLVIFFTFVKHRYRMLFEPALIVYTAILLAGGSCEARSLQDTSGTGRDG
ncbi:MAG: glycosyltransferase family 39 protein [bacterium]|nr:MAG: glycosyltransferase family 39 protein [bacterium]